MLKKNFRLPVGGFRRIKTKTLSSEFFSVKFSPNGLSHNRFAVIVSAKSAPKSTKRHLIKRKILSLSSSLPNLQTDFLFIATPKINSLSPKEITDQTQKLFSKLKT